MCANQPPRGNDRQLPGATGLLAAVALLSLAACSGGAVNNDGRGDISARVFATGYADLERIYIDDVEIDNLALAGVEGLSDIDPEIAIVRQGQSVQLAVRGETAGLYDTPAEADTHGWGQLTDSAVRRLSTLSPALAQADSESIYESVFDAVAENLDEYSRYASRREAQENRANRDGFGGVGIRIGVVPEGVAVQKVTQGTPAEQAGLQDGDVIVAIDGVSTAGIDRRGAVKALRGPISTEVRLTILREAKQLSIGVVRDFIVPQTVSWRHRDDVLILRVEGFNHDTTRALQVAVAEAGEAADKHFVGMILDLRGNPGGLLDQAVSVSDLFLDCGVIVTTYGRHPDSHQKFSAQPHNVLRDLPMVVMIDGDSASASEIVAAALQDNDRALVSGTVSYGKGSVQTLLRLPNEGELTLTWARFHAPSGYPLSGRGVLPNVCTSGTVAAGEALASAGHRNTRHINRRAVIDDRNKASLTGFRANCPPEKAEKDLDLEVALRLLHDRRLYRQLMNRDMGSLPN